MTADSLDTDPEVSWPPPIQGDLLAQPPSTRAFPLRRMALIAGIMALSCWGIVLAVNAICPDAVSLYLDVFMTMMIYTGPGLALMSACLWLLSGRAKSARVGFFLTLLVFAVMVSVIVVAHHISGNWPFWTSEDYDDFCGCG